MLESKHRFRHQSLQDSKSIQALLEAVSKGIERGELSFSDKDGEIIMHPKGLLELKLSASEEDSRHRLDIRISWSADDRLDVGDTLKVE
ncbi:MAG: amphi-Trp domain-containing protein [Oceanospirillales bacterium]|nr:amphi-Trp domain-containing protein [Oceanospirillales bacterium]